MFKRHQGTFKPQKEDALLTSFETAAENKIQIQPLSIKVPSFTHKHLCNFQSLKMALSKKQVRATVTKKVNFYNDSNIHIKKEPKETKDESEQSGLKIGGTK